MNKTTHIHTQKDVAVLQMPWCTGTISGKTNYIRNRECLGLDLYVGGCVMRQGMSPRREAVSQGKVAMQCPWETRETHVPDTPQRRVRRRHVPSHRPVHLWGSCHARVVLSAPPPTAACAAACGVVSQRTAWVGAAPVRGRLPGGPDPDPLA